jgi:hypothetical protein
MSEFKEDAFAQLLKLEKELPADPMMAAVHLRAMTQRLTELALLAAEERWPGFDAFSQRVVSAEHNITRRLEARA